MPPLPGSRHSSWELTSSVTELRQLEAGANIYTNEMKEEERGEADEKEERGCANPDSASLDPKNETSEPGSEFKVWLD